MRLVIAALLSLTPLWGHAISISTGDVTVRGRQVEYILRMPQYELKPGTPAMLLFTQLQLRSNGEMAKLVDAECHLDSAKNQYLCAANYAFSKLPGDLQVECSLQQVTVPNHVHMLKAERDGKYDQAILDSSFPVGILTFRPPTQFGIAVTQLTEAAIRMATSAAQVLLLLALAFSIRGHKERIVAAAAFFAGECAVAAVLGQGSWQPSPRFAEAAASLGLAYLAVELFAWPDSGGRWLLGLAFGCFSGLYFSLLLRESGFRASYVLSGSVLTGAFLVAIAGAVRTWLNHAKWMDRFRPKAAKIATWCLLLTGAVWFVARLFT